jgi:predicted thioesterase
MSKDKVSVTVELVMEEIEGKKIDLQYIAEKLSKYVEKLTNQRIPLVSSDGSPSHARIIVEV